MKILVIRNEPPWPLCYGGRLHCYELCRRLAAAHELLLAAQRPCERNDWPFNFQCRVARQGRLYDDDVDLPAEGYHANRLERFFGIDMRFTRDVVRLARQWRPDVVIGMNYQSLAYLARMTGVPRICDLQDDEALHALRELRRGCARGKGVALKVLAAALVYQRQHIRKVDAVTVLSEIDRRFCRWHTGHRRVLCIPHGVDCTHYTPGEQCQDDNLISFWGSLSFGPNLSALRYFARRVWPRVRRQRPRMRWIVMGRGRSAQLDELRDIPGIRLLGWVDDIRPHVARSAVAVVPMVSGAGIKNKIMEAWAMGKAVLCTPTALGNLPGVHRRNVWVGRTPRQLANGLIRLVDDRNLRTQIAEDGRRTALEHCSWSRAADELEQLCRQLVSEQHAATAPQFAGA